MLKVYTSYNCTSCKKATSWLEEHGFAYEEFNFFSKDLTVEEVKYMLKFTENGFEDIVSERSKIYERYAGQIAQMKIKDLIHFIIANPSMLKRPIIVDDVTSTVVVGYNKNDMEDLL
ncbi:MAG: Spx/MgsR family RNA polymerase-binding regulatory protein [Mycoplasmatales bacterium]